MEKKLTFDWYDSKNKKESIKKEFEPMVHNIIKEIDDDLLGIEISPEVAVIFEEFEDISLITDDEEIKKYGAPKVNEYRYKIDFSGELKNYSVKVFINKRDNYENVTFLKPKKLFDPREDKVVIRVNLNGESKSVECVSDVDVFNSLTNQINTIRSIINDGKTDEGIVINLKRYFKITDGVRF